MSVASVTNPPSSIAAAEDRELVEALRARDEDAYLSLVRRYTPLMLRVARSRLGRREVAEDVVQDTWTAVLQGIDRFEGRSSFRTWLMRILVNTASTRGVQERRTICRSTLPSDADAWHDELARRRPPEPGGPEAHALSGEAWATIRTALDMLPERQHDVVVLRDVEGWSAAEVCDVLDLSPGNQRILLHRGRVRLREMLAPLAAAGY